MNKIYEPGVCAKCHSDKIIYDDPILIDDLVYKYTCEDCGTKGEEHYELMFSYNQDKQEEA